MITMALFEFQLGPLLHVIALSLSLLHQLHCGLATRNQSSVLKRVVYIAKHLLRHKNTFCSVFYGML